MNDSVRRIARGLRLGARAYRRGLIQEAMTNFDQVSRELRNLNGDVYSQNDLKEAKDAADVLDDLTRKLRRKLTRRRRDGWDRVEQPGVRKDAGVVQPDSGRVVAGDKPGGVSGHLPADLGRVEKVARPQPRQMDERQTEPRDRKYGVGTCKPDDCPVKEFEPVPRHLYKDQTVKTTIGRRDEIAALTDALVTPIVFTELLGGQKPQNVMLYGPGGTGKTRMVRTVMNIIHDETKRYKKPDIPLFELDSADVKSKYVGVADKCLRFLLCVANRKPSVVMIDEADSMIGSVADREPDPATAQLQAKFKELVQDSSSKGNWTMVIVTNYPWRITDQALVQRFPKRIYIGPPKPRDLVDMLNAAMARKYPTCAAGGATQDPPDALGVVGRGFRALRRRMILSGLMTHMTARSVDSIIVAAARYNNVSRVNLRNLFYTKRNDGRYDPTAEKKPNAIDLEQLLRTDPNATICWPHGKYGHVLRVLHAGEQAEDITRQNIEEFRDFAKNRNDVKNLPLIEAELAAWDDEVAYKTALTQMDLDALEQDSNVTTDISDALAQQPAFKGDKARAVEFVKKTKRAMLGS
jgi:hypothetical protein